MRSCEARRAQFANQLEVKNSNLTNNLIHLMAKSIVGIAKIQPSSGTNDRRTAGRGAHPGERDLCGHAGSEWRAGGRGGKKPLKLQKVPVPARLLAASLEALIGLLAGIGSTCHPGTWSLYRSRSDHCCAWWDGSGGYAAGGVVGALVGLGIPESEAKVYEERLKEGGYLMAVQVQNNEVGRYLPGDHEAK